MGKMLVIYEKPADPTAFDKHYFNVHVPLAKRLPGLRRYAKSAKARSCSSLQETHRISWRRCISIA